MGSVSVSQYDISVAVSGSPVALTYQSAPNYSTATLTVNYQSLNGYNGTIYFGQPTMQFSGYLQPSLSSTCPRAANINLRARRPEDCVRLRTSR